MKNTLKSQIIKNKKQRLLREVSGFEELVPFSDKVAELIHTTSPVLKISKEYKNRSIF